jgi:adenosine deaminase
MCDVKDGTQNLKDISPLLVMLAITEALDLTKEDLTKLAINGFQATCMEKSEKKDWIDKVQVYYGQRKD